VRSTTKAEEATSAKVAKTVATLLGQTVTFDLQGAALGGSDAHGKSERVEGPRGGENVTGVNAPLTAAQKKEKKQRQNKKQKSPSNSVDKNSHRNRDRTARHFANLSKL